MLLHQFIVLSAFSMWIAGGFLVFSMFELPFHALKAIKANLMVVYIFDLLLVLMTYACPFDVSDLLLVSNAVSFCFSRGFLTTLIQVVMVLSLFKCVREMGTPARKISCNT